MKLKLAPVPTEMSPREKLAAAIDAVSEAEADLRATIEAEAKAGKQLRMASEVLETCRNVKVSSTSRVESFIAATRAGQEFDICKVASADPFIDMAQAEKNVTLWRETMEECRAARVRKESAVFWAKDKVKKAGAVVFHDEAEGRGDALLEAFERHHAAAIDLRSELAFLISMKAVRSEVADRATDLMQEHMPIAYSTITDTYDATDKAGYIRWDSALKALEHDAAAPLPSVTTL